MLVFLMYHGESLSTLIRTQLGAKNNPYYDTDAQTRSMSTGTFYGSFQLSLHLLCDPVQDLEAPKPLRTSLLRRQPVSVSCPTSYLPMAHSA